MLKIYSLSDMLDIFSHLTMSRRFSELWDKPGMFKAMQEIEASAKDLSGKGCLKVANGEGFNFLMVPCCESCDSVDSKSNTLGHVGPVGRESLATVR